MRRPRRCAPSSPRYRRWRSPGIRRRASGARRTCSAISSKPSAAASLGGIRIILEHDQPTFERWDPDAVARERRDCERDVTALLDELAALRRDSVALVNGLREPDLGRAGQHPAVGRLTVRDLLHEWVHHDRNHLRQILANVQAYVWPAMGNAQRFSRE